MDELARDAISTGFTHAVMLDGLTVECEARLREYCNPEGCPNHGSNWVCPPGCGTLEECAERVGKFSRGLLLQSVSALKPLFADYKGLNRKHNLRLREFIEKYCAGQMDVLALSSGGCIFCDTCAYPEPCVKPDVRMNSLSAYGIDVGKLCEKAGLEYAFRPDRVYYVALVLIS
jgi:predicted metal-binding protein